MPYWKIAGSLSLLLCLTIAGGCATTNENGPEVGSGNGTLLLEDIPAVGSLTVYLVPEVGPRRLVGHVGSGRSSGLRFDITSSGSYRFMAETLSRERAVSNSLYITPGAVVEWNLSSNIAVVTEGE